MGEASNCLEDVDDKSRFRDSADVDSSIPRGNYASVSYRGSVVDRVSNSDIEWREGAEDFLRGPTAVRSVDF
jgi:hypothetical protein